MEVVGGPNGLLSSARPGSLILIHSTVRPSTVHAVAEQARARGVRLVDAPVSRGSLEPEGKIIIYMLGGNPADFALARSFVAPSAKTIIEAGGLGAAMALKLSNNLVTYTELMAAREAFELARRSGLDPSLLLEVMIQNGNATPSMQAVMKNWAAQAGPLSEAALSHGRQVAAIGRKDLDCAIEVGREVGLDLPGAAVAREQVAYVMLGEEA
jgi:3-hydroxyisobutyrate dehydrogenase